MEAAINAIKKNKSFFSFQCREEKKLARSLLADWDFLPCVTVSVIAMSHFKGFMWVDGWSTTRERTVVKIPINEGQRNMTWTASGPYLPMTEPADWNCIPSVLGRGSVLSVSAGRLHFPLAGSCLMPLSAHPGVHPVLTSWWWIHNFSGRNELQHFRNSLSYYHAKPSCTSTRFMLLLGSPK